MINGYKALDVYTVGDYNENGVAFEEADLKNIKHAVENPEKLSTSEKYASDINGDGKLSEDDLTKLTIIHGEITATECADTRVYYSWGNNYSTCTATAKCTICGEKVATETATAVLDTTADANGNYYVRATFENTDLGTVKRLSYNLKDSTYTVYDANGLYAWGNAVKNNSALNLTLMADITMPNKDLTSGAEITVTNGVPSGSNWITAYISNYAGTVEGNNHKIIGLRKVGAKNQSLGGLIDMMKGGTIQNLSLEDVVVYHPETDWYVGGLVGYIYYKGGKVLNCHVLSGSVSAGAGGGDIGGIAGHANGNTRESIVDGCTNNAKVFGNGYSLGGIVGMASLNQIVSNCINYGDVSGNAEYVSGVVRIGSGNKDYTTVMYACVNYGNVSSTYANGQVGGVAAWVNGGQWGNAIMIACANYGKVSCSATPKYIGGVAALNNERMVACYTTEGAVVGANIDGDYTGTITGSYYVGSTDDGVDGTTAVTDINTTEVVNAMNTAINTWNTNNSGYQVNYKWQVGTTYPELVKVTAE